VRLKRFCTSFICRVLMGLEPATCGQGVNKPAWVRNVLGWTTVPVNH